MSNSILVKINTFCDFQKAIPFCIEYGELKNECIECAEGYLLV